MASLITGFLIILCGTGTKTLYMGIDLHKCISSKYKCFIETKEDKISLICSIKYLDNKPEGR